MESAEEIQHIIDYLEQTQDRLPLYDPFLGSATNEHIDQGDILNNVPPPSVPAPFEYQPPTTVLNPVYQESWKGEYGFEVAFEENATHTKSCSWTYSSHLQRLYVKDNTVIPFHLRVTSFAPYGDALYVSAHLKYSDHQHMATPVIRCPNHSSDTHSTNLNFMHPEHLIRVENTPDAAYVGGSEKYVRFLLPIPSTGETYGKARLRFMCPNSCPGGMNRRSTELLLKLENSAGAILGHFRTPIKICSCPGRDREKDEKKKRSQEPDHLGSGGVVNAYPSKKKRPMQPVVTCSPAAKMIKVEVEVASEELAAWIKNMADEGNKAHQKYVDALAAPRALPGYRNPM